MVLEEVLRVHHVYMKNLNLLLELRTMHFQVTLVVRVVKLDTVKQQNNQCNKV